MDRKQKLLIELFRAYRDDTSTTIGTYQYGKRLGRGAKTMDKIYKALERYMEIGYTEDDISIVEFYKRHYLETSLDERRKQRVRDKDFMLRKKQQKINLKFIEENELVEHPRYKGFYGKRDGRVFSTRGLHGAFRELKPILQKHNNGYYLVSCGSADGKPYGKRNQVLWHRFIAEIFIPNPNNLSEVNHLDEDKGNCCVDNLEWSTHLDNIRHSAVNWGDDYILQDVITGETTRIKNLMKWCKENDSTPKMIFYYSDSKKLYKNKYLITSISNKKGIHKK